MVKQCICGYGKNELYRHSKANETRISQPINNDDDDDDNPKMTPVKLTITITITTTTTTTKSKVSY